jgi:uncharacterized protein (DUF983 family)
MLTIEDKMNNSDLQRRQSESRLFPRFDENLDVLEDYAKYPCQHKQSADHSRLVVLCIVSVIFIGGALMLAHAFATHHIAAF